MESESRPPRHRRLLHGVLNSQLPWSAIAPVALLLAALATIAWLDLSSGGDAKPRQLVGESGTPVRGAYLAPTATPVGPQPTAKAKPTFAPGAPILQGSAADRDNKRRTDLLLLLDAAQKYRARNGAYPSTNNNVQTLCVYKELDVGCKLTETFGSDLPADVRGNQNGYWIQSDGQTIKLFASFEEPLNDAAKCPTNDAELKKRDNVTCVTAS